MRSSDAYGRIAALLYQFEAALDRLDALIYELSSPFVWPVRRRTWL
ncbi:hypothetical protein [Mycobacterium paraseoulense]|nr:hypothetical protein [Mycobacterium paraseoulense]